MIWTSIKDMDIPDGRPRLDIYIPDGCTYFIWTFQIDIGIPDGYDVPDRYNIPDVRCTITMSFGKRYEPRVKT